MGRLKERYKRVSAQNDVLVDRAKSETGQSAAIQFEDDSAAGETGTQQAGEASAKPVLATAVRWKRNDQHARKDRRAGT
ncbi:MAG: hypothetical protein OXN97_25145 [Bryobacterales bacterium]|nr:hypothetical protein [Bryobacterales bacterium]MDE0629786.1 hypothetical protein [Bryobacterales bacterium]